MVVLTVNNDFSESSATLSENVHINSCFLGKRVNAWLACHNRTVGFLQKPYINSFALEKKFHFPFFNF